MKRRRIKKILLIILIAFSGLIILLFVSINLPYGHRFITKKVNSIFTGAGLPIHITSITKIYPQSIAVKGVSITSARRDTIIYAGELQADFIPLALLKKRVVIPRIFLSGGRIIISRENDTLNIAAAFSNGKKDTIPKTAKSAKPWDISFRNAELSGISFRLNDSLSGIDINEKLADLKINMREMSLPGHSVIVNSIELSGIEGSIAVSPHPSSNDTTSSDTPWNILLERLELRNISQTFDNSGEQQINVEVGSTTLLIDKMDIGNKILDIKKFSLIEANLAMKSNNVNDNANDTKAGKKSENTSFPWKIEAKNLDIENSDLKLGTIKDSVPYFGLNDFFLSLSNLKLNKDEIAVEINKTSLNLENGFSINEMKGRIESLAGASTANLSLLTSNSKFAIDARIEGGLNEIMSEPEKITDAVVSISNTELSLKDLLYFKPELQKNSVLGALEKSPLSISISLNLHNSILDISEMIFKKDNLKLAFSGNIKNPFNKEKQKGNISISIPELNVDEIKPVLKEAGIKKDFPDIHKISMSASVEGSLRSGSFNASLTGDVGKTDLDGTFDLDKDDYYAKTTFTDAQPGKLLGDSLLGKFDGNIEIKAKGILKKDIVAEVIASVDSLNFNNYEYSGGWLNVKINDKKYDAQLKIDDPNLRLGLEATLNSANSDIDLKSEVSFYVNLNQVRIYKDTLEIEGKIKADFLRNKNSITSNLDVSGLKFTIPGNSALLPQSTASFRSDSVETTFNAMGDFFSIGVEIEKSFADLGTILPGYKRYLASFIDTSAVKRNERISNLPPMKVVVSINQNKALNMILNDSAFQFVNFKINVVNDLSAKKIDYNISGTDLKFQSIELGKLNASLTDSSGTLNLNIGAENCSLFSHHIEKISINNHFFRQQGITNLMVYQKSDKLMYDIEISSVLDSAHIVFSVPSKQLIMNTVQWILDSPDLMMYNRSLKKIQFGARMQANESFINIRSHSSQGLKTELEMKDVDIASLLPVDLISGKPSGSISGTASYFTGAAEKKEINADLKLSNIRWSDIAFKSFTIKSNYKSETPKDFAIDLIAKMDSSEFKLKATKPETGDQHFNAEFTDLAIDDVQPFVKKFLSDLRGKISGNVDISLSENNKNFNGELNIKQANVRIKPLNSIFKIPSDKLLFKGNQIIFDKFKVLDSLNNELIVDGSLSVGKSGDLTSDLEIISKNLQVMRSTEKENPTFFGNINIDSRLSIKGPVASPDLKGNVVLAGGTEIFFREKENLTLTETEKVMTFVKPVLLKGKETAQKKTINAKTSIDADVRIDPFTKINFQLTKRLFNINLKIKGGGDLSYSMQANKEVSLVGKYEITDGTTDVKITGWPNKSFTITRGGSVRWDGKLDDPELNFEAVNKVHTSYLNPVDNKQRDADVNVTLKLANKLSALDLLFTINTADEYLMSIINTLSPDEQMRQAITILLFGKIDLPGISTSSDYMTEQVNSLVASQLNQLTKTSISGVDISFGIDSYTQSTESGGQETKTSLSYEVKKELLNKRAQIEVSGRVNDVNKQPGASDFSLNNVSFEYRLDSAGTKFLKVYNEHTYEDVFEGEVIKTGVGLTYRKNYPTLRDILRKKNKKAGKDK